MKIFSLKYDDVFREVMSYEGIRKQLLSDVTGIPLEKIKTATLESPFLWKRYRYQKQGILDVLVTLDNGTRIDIELQVHIQKAWLKRKVFYLAQMYTEGLKIGQDYERLQKCISISILDFTLFEGEKYHWKYGLREEQGEGIIDLLEIHVIELNKELTGSGALEEWIELFRAATMEELDMLKAQTVNVGILDAIEVVRKMNLGKKLRWTYEARLKAKRDRKAEDDYVRDEGRAEGRIEGQMEGLVQGRAEGQEQLAQLIVRMSENGEAGQLERLSDAKFRNEMLQKYGLS